MAAEMDESIAGKGQLSKKRSYENWCLSPIFFCHFSDRQGFDFKLSSTLKVYWAKKDVHAGVTFPHFVLVSNDTE